MSESLKTKTITNIGYNSIAKFIGLGFGAVANIILTRTLTAADYGIVGFATIFISFLGQFSDLGINNALIHRGELDDEALYTGLSLKFCLGIVICLVSWIIAPFSVNFFDNSAIVGVIKVLSINFIINSFMFLPNVILAKELNFKKITIYSTLSSFFQSIVAIILALNGYKYWSIVYTAVITSVFTALVINFLKPVKIKFIFNRIIAHQLLSYGGNLFISGFLVFIIFNIDNFIIGFVAGADQLGYYALAFNWGSMMCTLLSSIILYHYNNNKNHLTMGSIYFHKIKYPLHYLHTNQVLVCQDCIFLISLADFRKYPHLYKTKIK